MASPQVDTLEAAIRDNREEIIARLRHEAPLKVAQALEREGWSREWSCKAVEFLELKYNPANLAVGPLRNQELRDKEY